MNIDVLKAELTTDPKKIGYNNPADDAIYYMTDQQAADRLNALDTMIGMHSAGGRLGSRAEELGLGHVTERHVQQAREN